MNKQSISQPRKTKASAIKRVHRAVKDLGLEVATEIGIELLKVDGLYYIVKNPTDGRAETVYPQDIFDTNDSSERYTAKEVMELIKS
jgi:hypothetical protein